MTFISLEVSNDFNTYVTFVFKIIFSTPHSYSMYILCNILYLRVVPSSTCEGVDDTGVSVAQLKNRWRTCSFVPLLVSLLFFLSLFLPRGLVVVLICFVFVHIWTAVKGQFIKYIYIFVREKKKNIRSKKTRNQRRKKCCYYYLTEENRVRRYI